MNKNLEWTTWPSWVFYAWYWWPGSWGYLYGQDDLMTIRIIVEMVRQKTNGGIDE